MHDLRAFGNTKFVYSSITTSWDVCNKTCSVYCSMHHSLRTVVVFSTDDIVLRGRSLIRGRGRLRYARGASKVVSPPPQKGGGAGVKCFRHTEGEGAQQVLGYSFNMVARIFYHIEGGGGC